MKKNPRKNPTLPPLNRKDIDAIRDTVAMQLAEVFYEIAMHELRQKGKKKESKENKRP